MDSDRRGFLLLAAGAAASAAVPGMAGAQTADTTLLLVAKEVGEGTRFPLAYGMSPDAPVLRVAKGGLARVRLVNNLGEPTALDWQGLRSGNAVEALPGRVGRDIPPGREATFELRPSESGTFWFHPPFMPGWSNQTARGLAGVLIVTETAPPPVDDDVILLLGDRSDTASNALKDSLSVNRKPWPETRTYPPGSRLRLRLVNGSTRKAVSATFGGARAMVIAIDGQPSELFRPLNDTLPVGPGARFDVLVDLPRTSAGAFTLNLGSVGEVPTGAAAPVFVVNLDGSAGPERPLIAALPPNPALPRAIPLEKATRAELTVHKADGRTFSINGSSGIALPKKPLFAARRNTAVTLGFTNRTPELIGFRLHGQAMRLLHSLDDGWEPYWRDSILVPPAKTVHAAFVADTPGRWLIESPFFDQATLGLRHWFDIT